jgi:hypothetical protein
MSVSQILNNADNAAYLRLFGVMDRLRETIDRREADCAMDYAACAKVFEKFDANTDGT